MKGWLIAIGIALVLQGCMQSEAAFKREAAEKKILTYLVTPASATFLWENLAGEQMTGTVQSRNKSGFVRSTKIVAVVSSAGKVTKLVLDGRTVIPESGARVSKFPQ